MRRFVLVAGILVLGLVGAYAVLGAVSEDEEEVIVVHWSNSHPMREGLLPQMAEEFNDADHETSDGRPIRVVLVGCDSAAQADDLVARANGGSGSDNGCTVDDNRLAPDPTIVTPQSTDWLVDVNDRAGRTVVDLETTENIAETWLGIVTYREMAECLGWKERQIGYADIVALRADPNGWASHGECARLDWGKRPLLSFTNPSTSTSGRNVLVSLYSMAVGKPPADITLADIERPEIVAAVQEFQGLVDHYLPTTLALNTKIAQGPGYGHFFLLPEDNLVSLKRGNEKRIGTDGTTQPLTEVGDLVMLYPSEGSVLNANPAGLVDASWVTPAHREGADVWIEFVRGEEQQEAFMSQGFRPANGTGLAPDERQFASWGLDVSQPTKTISPGDLRPEVLEGIIDSWGSVKKPAIVTFVVDVSGSMAGEKLEAVQDGMFDLLDSMAEANDAGNDSMVGLVAFESTVVEAIAPVSISQSKYDIADVVGRLEASGETALYDAVVRAIELTDRTEGEEGATRAVVVLSDGEATAGMCLADIVSISSTREVAVSDYCGHRGEFAYGDDGQRVDPESLIGSDLVWPTDHDVQIFFVGFGGADVNVGRVLAQATDAEYQGSTDDDLANVIEQLSGYF